MFVLVLASVLAACAAAPRFPHGPGPFNPPPREYDLFAPAPRRDPFGDDVFDTRQFWSEIANELRQLDDVLAQFYDKFPSVSSTQGVVGNEYKITLPLSGFDEKDIVVKAREGLLMVQAVHKLEGVTGERSYLDIKTLPTNVNVAGSWTFNDNVLKIVFPLKGDEDSESAVPSETEAPVTEGIPHSREEMDNENDGVEGDADVGAHGDQELKARELFTNEIPRNTVEATTYAVDLKDEVEFVPVRYR